MTRQQIIGNRQCCVHFNILFMVTVEVLFSLQVVKLDDLVDAGFQFEWINPHRPQLKSS